MSDPDARSMQHRGGGIVGYNMQVAVDTKNHLIVAHELTNVGHDRSSLAAIANQAKRGAARNAADRSGGQGLLQW